MEEQTTLEELSQEPTNQVVEEKPEASQEKVSDGEPKEASIPKENRYSKRVKELNTKWREEQRRAQELEDRLKKLEDQNKLKEKPDIDSYEDIEKYKRDQIAWDEQQIEKIRQEERANIKKKMQMEAQEKAYRDSEASFASASRKKAQSDENYRSHVDEVQKICNDFDLPDVQDLIINSKEIGPEVISFFGKNPDKLLGIADLSPAMRVFEMGKLVSKLDAKPKKNSSAPPPPRSESGSAIRQPSQRTSSKHVSRKGETFAERARRLNGR